MHKPVRPKSAKGKTRPQRQNSQRNPVEKQDSGATTSRSSLPSRDQQPSTSRRLITAAYNPATSKPSNRDASHQNSALHTTPSKPSKSSDANKTSSPHALFPEVTRPTSSLSKYRILPSIPGTSTPSGGDATPVLPQSGAEGPGGNYTDMDLLTEQAQQMILDSAMQRSRKPVSPPSNANKRKVTKAVPPDSESKRKKVFQTHSVFTPLRKPLVKEPPRPRVPREPGPGESRLLLALKLPDGSRVERFFHPGTKIIEVLAYAHSQYPILQASQCNAFRMDVVPKKLLSNTESTIEQAGIKHRTVLYIEEKEDE